MKLAKVIWMVMLSNNTSWYWNNELNKIKQILFYYYIIMSAYNFFWINQYRVTGLTCNLPVTIYLPSLKYCLLCDYRNFKLASLCTLLFRTSLSSIPRIKCILILFKFYPSSFYIFVSVKKCAQIFSSFINIQL